VVHPNDRGYKKMADAWFMAIPEPCTLIVLGLGSLVLGRRHRS